jgi:glutamyl-Q tRNA(Asp) synthetase
MPERPKRVIGRFAPSPTGPLHFGSLIAALGSYLQSRFAGGSWLVRMEDLDQPRTVPGAADDILRTLDAFALRWDGAVMYQSSRGDAYASALGTLLDRGLAYGCRCSRREIATVAQRSESGYIYPGTCRQKNLPPSTSCIRLRAGRDAITFLDGYQGRVRQELDREVGDFVVRRRDGIHAYQLAVVVDDAEQRINQVVRGSDLLTSTPRQIRLQTLLALPTPNYQHLPIAVTPEGEKLSKSTASPAVDRHRPAPALVTALGFLGQRPPLELTRANADAVLAWALAHWNPDRVPRQRTIPVTTDGVRQVT